MGMQNDDNNNKMEIEECINEFRCWECEKDCHMKRIFLYSDDIFNKMLHDTTKAVAGEMLLYGVPFPQADKARMELIMMLTVARIRYLEKIH